MNIFNNNLKKNILIGFIALLILTYLINKLSSLGKNNFWLYLLILIPILWLFSKIKLRSEKFNRGLVGENDIDKELDKLGSEYVCLKVGLNTSRGNIDKVVISPTGVWSLEVKSQSGQFTFDGQKLLRNGSPMNKDFLSQAYAEAKTLQEIIKSKAGIGISVNSVLVFSNKYAKVRFGFNKIRGVYVIQKEWLIKLITTSNINTLDQATINKLKGYFE